MVCVHLSEMLEVVLPEGRALSSISESLSWDTYAELKKNHS